MNEQSTAIWKNLLRHMPLPGIVLDAHLRILVVSNKAAELLCTTSECLEGEFAETSLSLSNWDPATDKLLDTRINGARVVFEVSHVSEPMTNFQATYLTIASLNSESFTFTPQTSLEPVVNDEEDNWKSMQYQLLEELPATIVAVSKDGRYLYQNAKAHEILGPIARPSGDLAAWLTKQYQGARNAEGNLLAMSEYPLYQAAVLGHRNDKVEVHFGRFSFVLSSRPLYNSNGQHCGGMVFTTDVTEYKEEAAEKERLALERSDLNFREIADNMEQMIWIGTGGQCQYFNSRWYEYTGASELQSIGLAWYNYVHPDDRENTVNNWLLVLESDQDHWVSQYRLRGVNGSYRWFIARALAIRDEKSRVIKWLGSSTDVTQITEALEDAKKAREQLFNIMQTAHVHYFVVSSEYFMTSVYLAGSPNGQGLYGDSNAASLMNRDVRQLLPPAVLEVLGNVLYGRVEMSTIEHEIQGVWWRTQFKVMHGNESSEIIGVVGTAIDITDEKYKDEQLAKASTDRLIALQNSRFKGEFLARMSHEIRTPIGGILGMVQLMKDTFHPEDNSQVFCIAEKESESVEYLESIRRCGDALLVIINDILDFSKIEVGKMDIENNPFDLHVLVNDVFVSAKHGMHNSNGVELILEYNVGKNKTFTGDCNRIRQVLMNLMSNALKFTESGTVRFLVDLCSDDTEAHTSRDNLVSRIRFKVTDTGIGISKPALDRLFNPFVQADSSTARKFGGTGLGLSIARQLVKLMSGVLYLESTPSPEPGHGSVATCIIPLEVSSKADLLKAKPPPLAKFLGQPKVLLVEDNKINQVIAQKTLQKLGLIPALAENGQEAVDYLLSTSAADLPEIILMDCQMPMLDGYEATKQIRQFVNSRLRTIPIVAMTASAISGDREKCLAAGMNDYVSKPISSVLLAQVLRKYLAQPASQSSASRASIEADMHRYPSENYTSSVRPSDDRAGLTHPVDVTAQKHSLFRALSRRNRASDLMDTSGH